MEYSGLISQFILCAEAHELEEMMALVHDEGFVEDSNESGLLMIASKDSFDTDFYIGEALVSEVIVHHGHEQGYGMVMGDYPVHVFLTACYDCMGRIDMPKARAIFNTMLKPIYTRYLKKLDEERAMASSTRVQFGLMTEG